MGEAKHRRSFSSEIRFKQPFCVYCGGNTLAVDIDHVPPKCMFDGKWRPRDPVVSACKECHEGTRTIDAIVGMLSRAFPREKSQFYEEDTRRSVMHVVRRHRNLIKEIGGFRQLDNGLYAMRANGPILSDVMGHFGARLGLSFYQYCSGKIIPNNGAVYVAWYSNYDADDNDLPYEFFGLLGPELTLQQGKADVRSQFRYGFCDAGEDFGFWFEFRASFAIFARAVRDIDSIPVEARSAPNTFRPGCLKGYILPDK